MTLKAGKYVRLADLKANMPDYPNGRGSRLRTGKVWVQILYRVPKSIFLNIWIYYVFYRVVLRHHLKLPLLLMGEPSDGRSAGRNPVV